MFDIRDRTPEIRSSVCRSQKNGGVLFVFVVVVLVVVVVVLGGL